jgi:hypothetical protein
VSVSGSVFDIHGKLILGLHVISKSWLLVGGADPSRACTPVVGSISILF